MQRVPHPAALLVLAALAPAQAGCRRGASPASSTDGTVRLEAPLPADPNARLDQLADEYKAELPGAEPVTGTWLGLHTADDRLDDASVAAQAREVARLRRVLDRLEAIPAARLDASHQLDRALLTRHARLALFELSELRSLERNPVRYVSIASAGISELLVGEFDSLPERLRSVTARLGRMRPLFEEARKNLRYPPEVTTRRAIELAQSTRAFLAEILPRVVSAVGDDRLLADFRVAKADALLAFDDYINFLQKDLLPRSKGEVGLGRDRLLAWIALRESIDLPADTLFGLLTSAADRELKAAQKRFDEATRLAAPGKGAAETLRSLDEDHPTAEQLLPAVQQAVDEVWGFTRRQHLLDLPASTPRVETMPPYLWGYALVETAAPFDDRERHAVYVDPVNPAWDKKTKDDHLRAFGRASLLLFAVHEPLGHVVQADAQRRAPSVAQKITASPSLAEGFPRYLEQTLLDEGLAGSDARTRFAQRREVLLALCRFAGALKLHALGGRLDDVTRLFSEEGGLDDAVARREAERVAVDPMVLDEALGLLALSRLRDQVAAERGARFDLPAFHRDLLAHGALPLGELRRLLLRKDDGSVL